VRTQKRMAVALSVASIFAGGTALAAGAATASTPTASRTSAVAPQDAAAGTPGTANLRERCRWVNGRRVCDYGDRGRERSRDWNRGRDRDRGWERGRDRSRDRDRGWERSRDRDWRD
jgi:transcription elongation factor